MSDEPTIQKLFDLTGKSALITGATGYLGSSLAAALAEAGANVIVGSRSEERARAAANALPSPRNQRHYGVEIDQTDAVNAERGFENAVALAGHLDILVNNGHEALSADWRTVTADEFSRQLSNATGYFLLARKLRDHATSLNRPASIVMIGSMYGVVGSYPDVYEGLDSASPAAYHALKGGVVHLTRHLAVYWAKDHVRVNALSPGPFPQPNIPAGLKTKLEDRSPTGRIGAPHELKGALLLLASDAGSYITGQNLLVDGGWTAW